LGCVDLADIFDLEFERTVGDSASTRYGVALDLLLQVSPDLPFTNGFHDRLFD
jgi:hypothetical protein